MSLPNTRLELIKVIEATGTKEYAYGDKIKFYLDYQGREQGAITAFVELDGAKHEFVLWNHQDETDGFVSFMNIRLNNARELFDATSLLASAFGIAIDNRMPPFIASTPDIDIDAHLTKAHTDGELSAFREIFTNKSKITIER